MPGGPVTIGQLAESGTLILVWCRCGHRAEVDPGSIRLPRSTPVPKIENRFRCQACGAKNTDMDRPVNAVADPRQKGITGAYPNW
jgi:hypothetical protein